MTMVNFLPHEGVPEDQFNGVSNTASNRSPYFDVIMARK